MSNTIAYHVIIPAAGCSRRLAHLTADKPKSLLEIAGKRIIEHSLDVLERRSFGRVTCIVGYRRELLLRTLGRQHGRLSIDYGVSDERTALDKRQSSGRVRWRCHRRRPDERRHHLTHRTPTILLDKNR